MSIDNKKINIVSDVNFDGNNITDAKINAQENTISNLEVSNFKSGVIQTTVRDTTNALDTAIPTEKAVSEALSNIQVNVIELDEGTNIDNLRQEGTFFIKNPTGTLPSITTYELDPEYNTYWCILTQEKCFDNTRGTYWYVQTGKFSYLSSGGITKIEEWQTYVRQINDYAYTDQEWQRLDNLTERIFDQPPTTEAADMSINLNTFSDAESNSVINVGYIEGLGWRTIKSLELVSDLNGSCKIFFKTYTGVPPYGTDAFSVILSSLASAQILNLDILTNYNFKFNTVYELNFQQISGGSSGKFSIEITEINKPFVQEYFPAQTGNSGKFLTTDGTTLSWAEVQGGGSLPNQTGQAGKFLTTNGTTASWATVDTVLPSQTGQSGKFLTTNGSTASWTTVSGGTSDYTDLTNKPSINGVTLTGNVSLSSLGVQSKNLVFENTTADSWVISDPNVYPDYVYECTVSCPGATTNSFAQVVFGPGEFDSGNYANVCSTGQDSVTMYSKVNDTINIPTIIIMGV